MLNTHPVAWQVQRYYEDEIDPGWGLWKDVSPCDLPAYQEKARLIPSTYRIRPLYTQEQRDQSVPETKSLNAMVADLLRPFLRPGQKVIWRESFRWFDDNGVLSNHYDGMEIEALAEEFNYEWSFCFNFKHAVIVERLCA